MKTNKKISQKRTVQRRCAGASGSAIPFENRDGHIMRLSGKMTIRELLKMGVVEIHLAKPGTPMLPGEWRDASLPNTEVRNGHNEQGKTQ